MESKFSTTDAVAALSADSANPDAVQLFGAFIEHYQHGVFGFLGRMGFTQVDAEDLAQEVFLKVWRYRASYDPKKAQPATWLYTIARNTALSKLSVASREHISLAEIEISADPHHQPDYQLQQLHEKKKLSAAIQQLTPDDRCAIALFYIDELSGAQAAGILQCSASAFKTRLSRARNKLKTILNKRDESYD